MQHHRIHSLLQTCVQIYLLIMQTDSMWRCYSVIIRSSAALHHNTPSILLQLQLMACCWRKLHVPDTRDGRVYVSGMLAMLSASQTLTFIAAHHYHLFAFVPS